MPVEASLQIPKLLVGSLVIFVLALVFAMPSASQFSSIFSQFEKVLGGEVQRTLSSIGGHASADVGYLPPRPRITEYPKVRRSGDVIHAHGVSAPDPYRWLEAIDDPETADWVKQQEALAASVLGVNTEDGVAVEGAEPSTGPLRKAVMGRITEQYLYDKYAAPFCRGGHYFYFSKKGTQNQSVLYTTGTDVQGPAAVVFDVNAEPLQPTAISAFVFSKFADVAVLGLAEKGSEWSKFRWFNVTERLKFPSGGPASALEMPPSAAPPNGQLGCVSDVTTGKFMSVGLLQPQEQGQTPVGYFYSAYPPDCLKAKVSEWTLPAEAAAATPSVAAAEASATGKDADYCLLWHAAGTPQAEDTVVYRVSGKPEWFYGGSPTYDGRFLVTTVSDGCLPASILLLGLIDVAALAKGVQTPGKRPLAMVTVVGTFTDEYHYITHIMKGDRAVFYFLSTRGGPTKQIVTATIALSEFNKDTDRTALPPVADVEWGVALPADPAVLLSDVTVFGENRGFVVTKMVDVADELSIWTLDDAGAVHFVANIPLPLGSVSSVNCRYGLDDVFIGFTSFTVPGRVYHWDSRTPPETIKMLRDITVPGFEPSDYEVSREFYSSFDGTRVPLFIARHKDTLRGMNAPTLLYGYGGFDISMTPSFSPSRLTWLAANGFRGIYALANIRGGGEYGRNWHEAAIKEKRYVAWGDFEAAARYLAATGWTSPSRIAIQGGSNGGLLVTATSLRAPDAIGAVVAQVGVMDLLRFHTSHVGHAWRSDYGDPDTTDITYLATTSPAHNVPRGFPLPPTLVLTGDHDDRVSPFHSFKYVSAAQNACGGRPDSLILCHLELNAGHGAGRPTSKMLEEQRDIFVFLSLVLRAGWYGPV